MIPLSERTKDEQKKIAKMGGKASGEARRKKRDLRECLLAVLEGKGKDGLTGAESLVKALYEEAKNGNVRAFETIRDTAYGKPVSTVEMTGKGGTPLQPPTFTIVAHE